MREGCWCVGVFRKQEVRHVQVKLTKRKKKQKKQRNFFFSSQEQLEEKVKVS